MQRIRMAAKRMRRWWPWRHRTSWMSHHLLPNNKSLDQVVPHLLHYRGMAETQKEEEGEGGLKLHCGPEEDGDDLALILSVMGLFLSTPSGWILGEKMAPKPWKKISLMQTGIWLLGLPVDSLKWPDSLSIREFCGVASAKYKPLIVLKNPITSSCRLN